MRLNAKILIGVWALAGVAGCSQIQAWTTNPTTLNFETQIQQAAVGLCGYLPSVESVAAIVAANNPLLALPEAVANAICAAVQPAATAKAGAAAPAPMVAGVAVTGKFVK
jgi:hypothetical protein